MIQSIKEIKDKLDDISLDNRDKSLAMLNDILKTNFFQSLKINFVFTFTHTSL